MEVGPVLDRPGRFLQHTFYSLNPILHVVVNVDVDDRAWEFLMTRNDI